MSRARFVLPVVAVALPLLVLATLVLRPVPAPREAVLVVVGSEAVVGTVVAALDSDDGRPFQVETGSSVQLGRSLVEEGRAVGVLVVDPQTETDVLYAAGASGSRLNDIVVREVEAAMTTLDRPLDVLDTHPPAVPRALPGILVAAGLLLGLCVVAARRLGERLRPDSTRRRHMAERIGTDALLAGVALGLAASFGGLPGSPPSWIALGALVVGGSALLAVVAARLLGPWGLVAVLAVPLTAVTAARAIHPLQLPTPWDTILPALPSGAATDLATRLALYGDSGPASAWIVLAGWAGGALLMLGALRWWSARRATPEPIEA